MSFTYKYLDFAKVLYEALKPDPFYAKLESSVDRCDPKESMLRYLDYSMIEAEIFGKLFVPEAHDYGVSIWSKPIEEKLGSEKKRLKGAFIKDYMGEGSFEVYNSIVEFMSEKAAGVVSDDCWYLSIVGVMPEFQGQGLGAELVKSVLKETDKYNIPTYLETFTPKNMSFYKRLGYVEAGVYREPVTGADYRIMAREPLVQ